MKIEGAVLLSGLSAIVKLAVVLVCTRYIASLVGPEGFLILGSYQNLLVIFMSIGSAGIMTGVVKYASEYSEQEKNPYISSASFIVLCLSPILFLIILLFPKSDLVFFSGSIVYKGLFFIAAFSSTLLLLINSLANAHGDNKKFIFISTVSASLLYLGSAFGAMLNNLEGFLLGILLSSFFSLIIAVKLYYSSLWFNLKKFRPKKDLNAIRRLLTFGGVAVISMICVPVGKIVIRNIQINTFGNDFAGQWDAIILISTSYMSPLYGILGFYFLPRYSKAINLNAIETLLISGIQKLGLVMLFGVSIVYFSSSYWLVYLYGESFQLIKDFLPFVIGADIFRFFAMLVAYLMLARNQLKIFAISEIFFNILYPILLLTFIQFLGHDAAGMSYLCLSIIYFLFVYFWYIKKFRLNLLET
jgi:PST family polysaccharide transporter